MCVKFRYWFGQLSSLFDLRLLIEVLIHLIREGSHFVRNDITILYLGAKPKPHTSFLKFSVIHVKTKVVRKDLIKNEMYAVIWFNLRLTVECVIIINPSSLFWNIFSMLWCMHDCLVEAFCLILNVGKSEASDAYES